MYDLSRIVEILKDIVMEESNRLERVHAFQEIIWDLNYEGLSEKAEEILGDLAHDLSYYEPNIKWWQESESYYGNYRLINEISSALEQLRQEGLI